jgi:hypothetical protein
MPSFQHETDRILKIEVFSLHSARRLKAEVIININIWTSAQMNKQLGEYYRR